jgi:hypothetical protein
VSDEPASDRPASPPASDPRAKRPFLERLGLALIALVLATLFGGMAVAAWIGGELFLAVMGGIGCAMTLWVGGLTLIRG